MAREKKINVCRQRETGTHVKPRNKRTATLASSGKVKDYRHEAKRKNNPDAGLASYDRVAEPKVQYSYDPHMDPQLVWSGKKEHTSFEVDTVSLHIHERISTQAILKTVQREDPQRDLFSDPQLPLNQAVEFYQHDVDWANRLILGDSLLVMNSLFQNATKTVRRR